MNRLRLAIAVALLGSATAVQATTVIIFVEPLTLDKYTRVFDTPGRDRVLMCMAPPAASDCTELRLKNGRYATVSSKPSNSRRPSVPPWAGSTTLSG
jgi:hypothetical protein